MTHLEVPDEFVLSGFVFNVLLSFGISVLKKSHSLLFLQRLEYSSPTASGINDYYAVINFYQVGLSLLSLATSLRQRSGSLRRQVLPLADRAQR
jgi:hypothetical protein